MLKLFLSLNLRAQRAHTFTWSIATLRGCKGFDGDNKQRLHAEVRVAR